MQVLIVMNETKFQRLSTAENEVLLMDLVEENHVLVDLKRNQVPSLIDLVEENEFENDTVQCVGAVVEENVHCLQVGYILQTS